MAEFFEYDPLTGIRTDTEYDEMSGDMKLIRTADVEPVLDHTKGLANEDGVWKQGVKDGWALYAKLPPIVILQMRAKGINVFDQNDQKRMFAEINSHYPHLKATTANEGGRTGKVHG